MVTRSRGFDPYLPQLGWLLLPVCVASLCIIPLVMVDAARDECRSCISAGLVLIGGDGTFGGIVMSGLVAAFFA